MLRIFLFVLFGIISNNAFANIKGKSLICDKDSRGYNFISKDKVVILTINFDEQIIFPVNHSYELSENAIFIQQPINVLKQERGFRLRFLHVLEPRDRGYLGVYAVIALDFC